MKIFSYLCRGIIVSAGLFLPAYRFESINNTQALKSWIGDHAKHLEHNQ